MEEVVETTANEDAPFFFVQCDIRDDTGQESEDGLTEINALKETIDHLSENFGIKELSGQTDLIS